MEGVTAWTIGMIPLSCRVSYIEIEPGRQLGYAMI